jgi:hypothetical protein
LSKAKLITREQSKMWVECEAENGEGEVFASARAMFVEMKASL